MLVGRLTFAPPFFAGNKTAAADSARAAADRRRAAPMCVWAMEGPTSDAGEFLAIERDASSQFQR